MAEEEFLAQAEGKICGYGKLAVSGIVEIGRELIAVKERVGHGKYERFVRDRLGWSVSAVLKFRQAFEMFESVNFTDLDSLTIDASSLYLIAAPSTPEEARPSTPLNFLTRFSVK